MGKSGILTIARKGNFKGGGLIFYTLVHKTVKCPLWGEEIRITAKYRYDSDPDKPYLAHFFSADCEILENLRQPVQKRNKRLALYGFCNVPSCPFLADFPKEIDVREH